jgi:hypothetical protein
MVVLDFLGHGAGGCGGKHPDEDGDRAGKYDDPSPVLHETHPTWFPVAHSHTMKRRGSQGLHLDVVLMEAGLLEDPSSVSARNQWKSLSAISR